MEYFFCQRVSLRQKKHLIAILSLIILVSQPSTAAATSVRDIIEPVIGKACRIASKQMSKAITKFTKGVISPFGTCIPIPDGKGAFILGRDGPGDRPVWKSTIYKAVDVGQVVPGLCRKRKYNMTLYANGLWDRGASDKIEALDDLQMNGLEDLVGRDHAAGLAQQIYDEIHGLIPQYAIVLGSNLRTRNVSVYILTGDPKYTLNDERLAESSIGQKIKDILDASQLFNDVIVMGGPMVHDWFNIERGSTPSVFMDCGYHDLVMFTYVVGTINVAIRTGHMAPVGFLPPPFIDWEALKKESIAHESGACGVKYECPQYQTVNDIAFKNDWIDGPMVETELSRTYFELTDESRAILLDQQPVLEYIFSPNFIQRGENGAALQDGQNPPLHAKEIIEEVNYPLPGIKANWGAASVDLPIHNGTLELIIRPETDRTWGVVGWWGTTAIGFYGNRICVMPTVHDNVYSGFYKCAQHKLEVDRWNHVAVTIDGTKKAQLFTNGQRTDITHNHIIGYPSQEKTGIFVACDRWCTKGTMAAKLHSLTIYTEPKNLDELTTVDFNKPFYQIDFENGLPQGYASIVDDIKENDDAKGKKDKEIQAKGFGLSIATYVEGDPKIWANNHTDALGFGLHIENNQGITSASFGLPKTSISISMDLAFSESSNSGNVVSLDDRANVQLTDEGNLCGECSDSGEICAGKDIRDGQFHHVLLVCEMPNKDSSGNALLYLDGKLVDQAQTGGWDDEAQGSLFLGNVGDNTSHVSMVVADFSVYDYATTPEETRHHVLSSPLIAFDQPDLAPKAEHNNGIFGGKNCGGVKPLHQLSVTPALAADADLIRSADAMIYGRKLEKGTDTIFTAEVEREATAQSTVIKETINASVIDGKICLTVANANEETQDCGEGYFANWAHGRWKNLVLSIAESGDIQLYYSGKLLVEKSIAPWQQIQWCSGEDCSDDIGAVGRLRYWHRALNPDAVDAIARAQCQAIEVPPIPPVGSGASWGQISEGIPYDDKWPDWLPPISPAPDISNGDVTSTWYFDTLGQEEVNALSDLEQSYQLPHGSPQGLIGKWVFHPDFTSDDYVVPLVGQRARLAHDGLEYAELPVGSDIKKVAKQSGLSGDEAKAGTASLWSDWYHMARKKAFSIELALRPLHSEHGPSMGLWSARLATTPVSKADHLYINNAQALCLEAPSLGTSLCGGKIMVDRWQNIAVIANEKEVHLCINGENVATARRSRDVAPALTDGTPHLWRIGNSTPSSTRAFSGYLHSLSFWNTQQEQGCAGTENLAQPYLTVKAGERQLSNSLPKRFNVDYRPQHLDSFLGKDVINGTVAISGTHHLENASSMVLWAYGNKPGVWLDEHGETSAGYSHGIFLNEAGLLCGNCGAGEICTPPVSAESAVSKATCRNKNDWEDNYFSTDTLACPKQQPILHMVALTCNDTQYASRTALYVDGKLMGEHQGGNGHITHSVYASHNNTSTASIEFFPHELTADEVANLRRTSPYYERRLDIDLANNMVVSRHYGVPTLEGEMQYTGDQAPQKIREEAPDSSEGATALSEGTTLFYPDPFFDVSPLTPYSANSFAPNQPELQDRTIRFWFRVNQPSRTTDTSEQPLVIWRNKQNEDLAIWLQPIMQTDYDYQYRYDAKTELTGFDICAQCDEGRAQCFSQEQPNQTPILSNKWNHISVSCEDSMSQRRRALMMVNGVEVMLMDSNIGPSSSSHQDQGLLISAQAYDVDFASLSVWPDNALAAWELAGLILRDVADDKSNLVNWQASSTDACASQTSPLYWQRQDVDIDGATSTLNMQFMPKPEYAGDGSPQPELLLVVGNHVLVIVAGRMQWISIDPDLIDILLVEDPDAQHQQRQADVIKRIMEIADYNIYGAAADHSVPGIVNNLSLTIDTNMNAVAVTLNGNQQFLHSESASVIPFIVGEVSGAKFLNFTWVHKDLSTHHPDELDESISACNKR